jgi:cytochrome P450
MTENGHLHGPRGLPFVGSLFALQRDPLHFLLEAARDYGDIVPIPMPFGYRLYLFNHPDYIRHVLVDNHKNFTKSSDYAILALVLGEGLLTLEGDEHRHRRRLVQPAFHRKRIEGYAATMAEYGAEMCERWRDGQALDFHKEMTRVTLRIVARALFDADVEREAAEVGDAISTLMPMFDSTILLAAPWLFRFTPASRRAQKAIASLDSIVFQMIAEHRKSGKDSGDLMSMLLAAHDEEDSNRRLTDRNIRDEVMTLFLAGHETTANLMTWTFYLLSRNPEAEARLHSEIDSVLAGHAPAIDDVSRLEYTRMVLNESMRLYPPAWAIGRRAIADFEVGGHTIPAGSDIFISQWVTHHDPRFFPDPLRFEPERWTPEAEASRPDFSYFPFGGGPRLCIGESFAKMEAALLIATIAQRWRIRLAPGARVDTLPLVTLRPRYGFPVILEHRSRIAASSGPLAGPSAEGRAG